MVQICLALLSYFCLLEELAVKGNSKRGESVKGVIIKQNEKGVGDEWHLLKR
jgi:hypothetical protein